MTLKIGLVSSFDYAVHGGVNDHINNLAEQFRESGHTVKVIAPCSTPDDFLNEDFIPIGKPVPIPTGGSVARVSLTVRPKSQVVKMLEKEVFDIIHLHEPFSGALPIRILTESKTVNIGTFHSYKGAPFYQIGIAKFLDPYFQKLDGRIAVSKPALDYITSYFPGKYEVIPNGIGPAAFRKNIDPLPQYKDGMINLLFLGRLEKRKGLKYLLKAFSKLKWDWHNLRLIVVGNGTPDSESLGIISERNIKDVEFVGSVSDEIKNRYYRTADIYCSPSTGRESFGIVLLEAMAAGVPIVASAIEGHSSIMIDGREGFLTPPKDDNAIADAIAQILKSPELATRMGDNGRKTALQYRWDYVSKIIMDYYMCRLESRLTLTK